MEPRSQPGPQPVPGADALLGEGAIWDPSLGRLLWIDIVGRRLFCLDPERRENRAFDVGEMVGTVVPRTRGGVLLALHGGLALFDPASGRITRLPALPEYDPAVVRFNDGKCDPSGRLWVGSMALIKGPRPLGRLYRIDADGSASVMLHDVGTSNGLAWSLDRRTLYFIDTALRRVDAFDYDDASGGIGGRRTVITVPPDLGRPDGSTLDAEGMLWIAMFEGGCVTRWNPATGELLETIRLPVSRVTSCAFGGPDLRTLFITTSRHALPPEKLEQQPLAGRLFEVRPGSCGLVAQACRI